MFDNIQILKAIDERQQQVHGSPLRASAHELLKDITRTFAVDWQQMAGFLQELQIANAAGQLTWRLINQNARPQDANNYLQQIYDIALTPSGQDRARGRVVVQPVPDPDEDDGHQLSDLILSEIAAAISREYASDQVIAFLGDEGLPPEWLTLPHDVPPGDPHAILAATWRAGSEDRRSVRYFIGRWIDDQLVSGPDAELRARLIEQLARQGWRVREVDSVLVAAEPIRGIPTSSPFLRATRLHPLVEAEARPQFLINKPDQAVFASMKAVEVRVRKLGGFGRRRPHEPGVRARRLAHRPFCRSRRARGHTVPLRRRHGHAA